MGRNFVGPFRTHWALEVWCGPHSPEESPGYATDTKFVSPLKSRVESSSFGNGSELSQRLKLNPISGRLLATPISGKGGLFSAPP